MSIWLVDLPTVQGVGFYPIPRLITSIPPVNHFSIKKVPRSLFLSLYPYHTTLFLIYLPSHPLYLWSGILPPRGLFLFSLELFLSPDKTPYVSLVYLWLVRVWCIHESLGSCCWLCLGHHEPPHINLSLLCSVFLIPRCHPVTISLGEYFWHIHLPYKSGFNHITIKYTIWIVIYDGR